MAQEPQEKVVEIWPPMLMRGLVWELGSATFSGQPPTLYSEQPPFQGASLDSQAILLIP